MNIHQMPDDKRQLINMLIDILFIDGAHHKQFGIELALENLVGEDMYKSLKEENKWEEGIPP